MSIVKIKVYQHSYIDNATNIVKKGIIAHISPRYLRWHKLPYRSITYRKLWILSSIEAALIHMRKSLRQPKEIGSLGSADIILT